MAAKRPTSKAPNPPPSRVKASRSKSASAPRASRKKVERIVSIPADVVLSPSSELPRHLLGGEDRSQQRTPVRELSWAEFDRQVQGLARSVRGGFKPEAVVGLAHGGVFVGGALASALGCDHFPVRISRRSRDTGMRAQPKLSGTMPRELQGRRVLVVDDIASSGDTLELAVELAKKVGAREVRTATLVSREDGFTPNYGALKTDELVVFPWDYGPVVEDARFDVDPEKAGA